MFQSNSIDTATSRIPTFPSPSHLFQGFIYIHTYIHTYIYICSFAQLFFCQFLSCMSILNYTMQVFQTMPTCKMGLTGIVFPILMVLLSYHSFRRSKTQHIFGLNSIIPMQVDDATSIPYFTIYESFPLWKQSRQSTANSRGGKIRGLCIGMSVGFLYSL